jgi:alpha/beta superfamily hydrolase
MMLFAGVCTRSGKGLDMHVKGRSRSAVVFAVGLAAGLAAGTGCSPGMPVPGDPPAPPPRELLEQKPGAALYREDGVEDALWLEMDRPAASGGPIGGYYTQPQAGREAMVLVLEGANPGGPETRLPHTLTTHRSLGSAFVEAGFTTWTPMIRECGTPYGQDDLVDALAIVDWLEGGGAVALGAERLYVVGYSKGAMLATLLNERRTATAYISLNGLTRPNQLEDNEVLYRIMVSVLPYTEGLCQIQSTLAGYGPPGSPGWDVLDAVSRIGDLHSPELFVHDLGDFVYTSDNTQAMQERYEAGLAAGEPLVQLDFLYLEGSDHFAVRTDPAIHQQIIDYLNRFEPATQVAN